MEQLIHSVQLGAMLWPTVHSTVPTPKGVVSLPSVLMF